MQSEKFVVVACLASYLVLAVVLASVRAPQSDEGHFAEGAANLATTGRLTMPTWTPWIPSLNQRVYAVMPAYFIALAGWFRLFGIGMLTMRYFTVLWGAILVLSYFLLIRETSGDATLGLVSIVLLAFGYDLINLTTARYDAMSAGLASLGLAIYALMRERNLPTALVLANICIACAAMTHPYGALGFVYFCIYFFILDRERFRFSQLLFITLPYVAILAVWGLYIAKDPAMFKSQFSGNAAAHTVSVFRPWAALASELRERYWLNFGGESQDTSGFVRLRLGVLALYTVSFLGALWIPEIRKQKASLAVLGCATVGFLALTFGEGSRGYIYLVHIIGFYSLVAAIWIRHLIGQGGWRRSASFAVVAGLGLFTIATISYRGRQDSYVHAFLPAAHYLQQHLTSQQLVFAGGDFGVPLGFSEHVLDDRLLGRKSHRQADYIVIDRDYSNTLQQQRIRDPELNAAVMQTLHTYTLVFESKAGADYYRIYARGSEQRDGDSKTPAH